MYAKKLESVENEHIHNKTQREIYAKIDSQKEENKPQKNLGVKSINEKLAHVYYQQESEFSSQERHDFDETKQGRRNNTCT